MPSWTTADPTPPAAAETSSVSRRVGGRHGVTEPEASLAAEAGIALFKVGFHHWIAADEERELSLLMREALDALKAVTAGSSPGR
ncbi:hypothetical protein ACFT9I_14940 [Streptomyces sp. NPDC057137]|uniref:hypothetical protein n=1 Tax=Streptomyces sp. NPDC057137 TaxID=3346030 RepID=UPI003632B04E